MYLYMKVVGKKATKIHTHSSSCLWEGEQLGGTMGQVNGVFTFGVLL